MAKQKINGRPCTYCTKERLEKGLQPRMATQIHEQYGDTKDNRRLYGRLIDDSINAKPSCAHCNVGHANVTVWNEYEFCEALGIEPRSKVAQMRKMRERRWNGLKVA